ncbi:ROK family protein [Paenibacillus cremeus]|uniref:ROK family protein n=1 Tax=Paenibacillus cremeus TaxID=2163881 RepID=UPI0016449EA2|nr:ROK family protein [Paenibacillus cremeus]
MLGFGIGSVGPIDRKNGIILDPVHFSSIGGNNIPICNWLEQEIGIQVSIDNGANASLLGEYWSGHLQDQAHLLYLHVGVGIRSAIMTGGKMMYGAIELEVSIGQMIIMGGP